MYVWSSSQEPASWAEGVCRSTPNTTKPQHKVLAIHNPSKTTRISSQEPAHDFCAPETYCFPRVMQALLSWSIVSLGDDEGEHPIAGGRVRELVGKRAGDTGIVWISSHKMGTSDTAITYIIS